jgi:hypothetical protein
MAKLAGDSDESNLRQALDVEAKRLIVDTTYTGRGHQAAGRRLVRLNHWLGLPTAIATTVLASGAGVTALLNKEAWITASLALLAATTSACHGFLRPAEQAEAHALKGNRFIALRNEARVFRELDVRSGLSHEKLSERLKDLRRRYAELNEAAPLLIPQRDYEAAKRSIVAGESRYEGDPVWEEMSD